MIYDLITNIVNYKGISEHLDKAIEFIASNDLNSLPLGRTDIDGDNVFINIMEATTKGAQELNFEYHKNYMDIQIDLVGTEMIQVATEGIEEVEAYKEDIGFFKANTGSSCILGPGRFIVCMIEELHKPGIQVGFNTAIKKCVVKVKK